jgi:hypothetical protein
VRLSGCDLLTLDAWGALVARLEDSRASTATVEAADTDEEEGAGGAGPLSLAIDVSDAGGDPPLSGSVGADAGSGPAPALA